MADLPRRFTSGCWTCSLRKKKCDGARPHCQVCSDRGLHCDGFEALPAWTSSKEAQSTRLAEVKRIVKENFRSRMRKTSQTKSAGKDRSSPQSEINVDSTAASPESIDMESPLEPLYKQPSFKKHETLGTISTEEVTTQPGLCKIESRHEYSNQFLQPPNPNHDHLQTVAPGDKEQILHYVRNIFHVQFCMCAFTSADDKDWLASFIATSSMLRNATICLSILFGKTGVQTRSVVDLHKTEHLALEYYGKALSGLITALNRPASGSPLERAERRFESLATIAQLMYLEVYMRDFHNIPIHACAAQRLLLDAVDHTATEGYIDASHKYLWIIRALNFWIKPAMRWLTSITLIPDLSNQERSYADPPFTDCHFETRPATL